MLPEMPIPLPVAVALMVTSAWAVKAMATEAQAAGNMRVMAELRVGIAGILHPPAAYFGLGPSSLSPSAGSFPAR